MIKDERTLYVPVGCGKCIECMNKKAREWQIRLYEEIKTTSEMKFVTLTFSEESLIKLEKETKFKNTKKILENEIATTGVRKFLERWRKEFKTSVKHWLVTELGHNGTERIHLHGVIFSDDEDAIIKNWKYGYIYFGTYVNEQTINYIVKYVSKIDNDHKGYIPKILTSAGIGKNFLGCKIPKGNELDSIPNMNDEILTDYD